MDTNWQKIKAQAAINRQPMAENADVGCRILNTTATFPLTSAVTKKKSLLVTAKGRHNVWNSLWLPLNIASPAPTYAKKLPRMCCATLDSSPDVFRSECKVHQAEVGTKLVQHVRSSGTLSNVNNRTITKSWEAARLVIIKT